MQYNIWDHVLAQNEEKHEFCEKYSKNRGVLKVRRQCCLMKGNRFFILP
jgi:hypothetical protein